MSDSPFGEPTRCTIRWAGLCLMLHHGHQCIKPWRHDGQCRCLCDEEPASIYPEENPA